jgi:flagellar motor component MotA
MQIVGPMATALTDVANGQGALKITIRSVLVAHLHGKTAQISAAIGRRAVPCASQPSFAELETHLNSVPAE